MTVTSLQAIRQRGDQEENERLAKHFFDAARRALKGEFKSVAWFAQGRDDFAAHFGWHKFGTIMPLIGAGYTMLQEMATSPQVPLVELEDDDGLSVRTGIGNEGAAQLDLFAGQEGSE